STGHAIGGAFRRRARRARGACGGRASAIALGEVLAPVAPGFAQAIDDRLAAVLVAGAGGAVEEHPGEGVAGGRDVGRTVRLEQAAPCDEELRPFTGGEIGQGDAAEPLALGASLTKELARAVEILREVAAVAVEASA